MAQHTQFQQKLIKILYGDGAAPQKKRKAKLFEGPDITDDSIIADLVFELLNQKDTKYAIDSM